MLFEIPDIVSNTGFSRDGLYQPELKSAIGNFSYCYLHQCLFTEWFLSTWTRNRYLKLRVLLSTPKSYRGWVIFWTQKRYLKLLVLLSTAKFCRVWVRSTGTRKYYLKFLMLLVTPEFSWDGLYQPEFKSAIWNSSYCYLH